MKTPKPPKIEKTPAPPTPVDLESGAELEQSLLRRRKGMKESYLTKGQKKPSMLSKGDNQL